MLVPLINANFIRPTNRRRAAKTMLIATGAALALLAGCATPGPTHVYATCAGASVVHDLAAAGRATVPALQPGEVVQGLAYDYNLDQLFLRLAPAQVIRAVHRASGTVVREWPLPPELRAAGPADLTLRSRDRRLFAAHPDGRSVVEFTLLGVPVRRIELPGLSGPIGGLAFDQRRDLLLVLADGAVTAFTPEGRIASRLTLGAPVRAVALGYDSAAGHVLAPLADGCTLGEFDATGALIAAHRWEGSGLLTGLAAGQRSFVRVF